MSVLLSWRENVEANLANDEWLLWLGGGAIFWLFALCTYAVIQAVKPPDDEELEFLWPAGGSAVELGSVAPPGVA